MTSVPGTDGNDGYVGRGADVGRDADDGRDVGSGKDAHGAGGSPAEPAPPVCARCGTTAGESQPLTWTVSTENGVRRHICDACSRENLRAIEGRLDSSWW